MKTMQQIEEEAMSYAALEEWGEESQVMMFIEEAGECITAISHRMRGRCSDVDVLGEMADLQIMLNQMVVVYDDDDHPVYPDIYDGKLEKLSNLLEGE